MPLKPTGELITAARAGHRGLAAFNVITLEHAEAIVAAAESVQSPVILQISENAVKFHHGRLAPIARASAAVAEAAGVEVALHLDHVEDPALLRQAADYGFGSAMFDGSHLAYDANVAATREAADWAHARGLWLEAELGKVGGKDGEPPLSRTPPAPAPTRGGARVRRGDRRGRPGGRGRQLARDDRPQRRSGPRAHSPACATRSASRWCCTAPPACRTRSWPGPSPAEW